MREKIPHKKRQKRKTNKEMRVLHIHPSLSGGGIKTMIYHLANAMSEQGCDVEVCTIYKPTGKEYAYSRLKKGIRTSDLGRESNGFSLKAVVSVYKYIKRNNFDIVHMHGFFYYYVLAVLLLHKRTCFVYTIHSDAKKENGYWDKKILWIKRYCFRHGWMHAVTISHASERSFDELYEAESRLIYNGIAMPKGIKKANIEEYRLTKETKILFHAGRITEAKNQVMLCKVIRSIVDEGYDIVLLMAGECQDKGIYEEIKKYLSDRIIYAGERADSIEIMAAADGFCLPSVWEGMPMTLLEAMSVGCVPICTPVGGINDIVVNGENGILSEDGSEERYRDAVEHYLQMDERERERMRMNGVERAKEYDIRKTAEMYLAYYADLIGKRK